MIKLTTAGAASDKKQRLITHVNQELLFRVSIKLS